MSEQSQREFNVVDGQLWEVGYTDFQNVGGRRAMLPTQSGQPPARATFSDASYQLLKQYQPGTPEFNQIRSLLIKHYGLSNSSLGKDAEFTVAFERALNDASVANYNFITASPRRDTSKTLTLMDYLKGKQYDAGAGATSGPTSQISYTGKPTAWDTFRNMSKQLLGAAPSKSDFEEFYKKLHAKEKQYIDKANADGSVVTRNDLDINDFAMNYIVSRIDLSNSDMSGRAGEVQDTVMQAISDYGLKGMITSKTKVKLVRGLLDGSLQQKDIDDVLRDQAVIAHQAFAEEIKANPNRTFLDIVQPYVAKYAQTLEIPEMDIDVNKVINLATGKDNQKVAIGNFDAVLRSTSEFSKTKTAKGEAQDLAAAFARAFGVNI
jgi:hypothetical protein